MDSINVNTERCKGCGYCVESCPKNAVSMSGKSNSKGFNYIVVDYEKCVACGNCYQVCPDCVFEIL